VTDTRFVEQGKLVFKVTLGKQLQIQMRAGRGDLLVPSLRKSPTSLPKPAIENRSPCLSSAKWNPSLHQPNLVRDPTQHVWPPLFNGIEKVVTAKKIKTYLQKIFLYII
jgi:hypothetical protein